LISSLKIFLFRNFCNSFSKYIYVYLNRKILSSLEPIFIVGCQHSGSSILLRILGEHQHLFPITYESNIFNIFYKKLDIRFQGILWQKYCERNNKKRWIEKTPDHIFKIDSILEIFPHSKILLMVRDGRDVTCSLKARSGDYNDSLNLWIKANEYALRFCNKPRIKFIKLENLVSEAEKVLNEICEFIEEKYNPNLLDYHKVKKLYYTNLISPNSLDIIKPESSDDGENHLNLRNWQINQPLFKNTNRWNKELNEDELILFYSKAKELMLKLGYEL